MSMSMTISANTKHNVYRILDHRQDIGTTLYYAIHMFSVCWEVTCHYHGNVKVSGINHYHGNVDVSGINHYHGNVNVSGINHYHGNVNVSGINHYHGNVNVSEINQICQ